MKKLLFILLSILLASPVQAWWLISKQVVTSGGSSCSETATFTRTDGASTYKLGNDTTRIYVGGVWNGSTFTLCSVEAEAYKSTTGVDARNYRIEVWSVSAGDLDTIQGYSDNVLGSVFSLSQATVTFDFTTPVSVSSGDAIVMHETSDTADATNYVRILYTSATDTDLDVDAYNSTGGNEVSAGASTINFTLYPTE